MKRLVLLGPVFAHGRAVTKAGRGRAGLERGAGLSAAPGNALGSQTGNDGKSH